MKKPEVKPKAKEVKTEVKKEQPNHVAAMFVSLANDRNLNPVFANFFKGGNGGR